MKRLLLLMLIALATIGLSAQNRGGKGGYRTEPTKGTVFGKVVLTSQEAGKPEEPGTGVIVLVVSSLKDKRYAVADSKGFFVINGVKPGPAVVKFSMMGYESQEKAITIVPGQNRLLANLKPAKNEITQAVVKGYVEPVTVIADTVVFNAAAVKVNVGEMAIDILEQMPGVTVTETGVTILDEEVKHVYIDGALLFGEAPMQALNNMSADDIVSMRSYQEYANKDPHHKISKNEEKQRVLDVVTKSKPKFVKAVNAIAGGGFDTDTVYRKFRYTLGADAHFFSEKLRFNAKVNVNNINDNSNRRRGNSFRTATSGGSVDLRNLGVSLSAKKKWMSPTTRNFVLGAIGGGYTYSDKYDVTESITQLVYFPSSKYDSRETDKRVSSAETDKVHTFNLGGEKALRDGRIVLDATYSISHNGKVNSNGNFTRVDGGAAKGSLSRKDIDNDVKSYDLQFNFNKGFADRFRIKLAASASGNDRGRLTAREDSVSSTITKTVIDMDGTGKGRSWSVAPTFRFEIDDNTSIAVKYSYDDVFRRGVQLAYDVTDPLDPICDTVNTYRYTTATKTHQATIAFNRYFEAINAKMHLEGGYATTALGRDDSFPEAETYDRHYKSLVATAKIGNDAMMNNWSVVYRTSATVPTLEQFRPRLNNSNLYALSAGNPDIGQSIAHTVKLSYSSVLGATEEEREMLENEPRQKGRKGRKRTENMQTFGISVNFAANRNPIVTKQMFFTEETYLPLYDYWAPAQSTLSTYENADASYSVNAKAEFGTPLKRMMCILTTTASFAWDRTPSYIDYTPAITTNVKPTLRIGLRTNFSKNIRLNLNVTGAYVHSENTLANFKDYFYERINFGWEFNNIWRHLYVGGNYFKQFSQGLEENQKFNDNIFNVKLGAKFGPKNCFDVSASAHDIFNNTTGFSTSMKADYVSNVWKRQFGRYVMFTFSYRFNKGGRRNLRNLD